LHFTLAPFYLDLHNEKVYNHSVIMFPRLPLLTLPSARLSAGALYLVITQEIAPATYEELEVKY